MRDTSQWYPGSIAMMRVARGGHRAKRDAMEAIREGDYVRATRDVACNLHRRFNCIGAGRAGELHHVIHVAWLEDQVIESLQKLFLCLGVEIETMCNAVALDVGQQSFLERVIVVPVVESSCTGQEVEIGFLVQIVEPAALGSLEGDGEGAGVTLYFGFDVVKDVAHVGSPVQSDEWFRWCA